MQVVAAFFLLFYIVKICFGSVVDFAVVLSALALVCTVFGLIWSIVGRSKIEACLSYYLHMDGPHNDIRKSRFFISLKNVGNRRASNVTVNYSIVDLMNGEAQIDIGIPEVVEYIHPGEEIDLFFVDSLNTYNYVNENKQAVKVGQMKLVMQIDVSYGLLNHMHKKSFSLDVHELVVSTGIEDQSELYFVSYSKRISKVPDRFSYLMDESRKT